MVVSSCCSLVYLLYVNVYAALLSVCIVLVGVYSKGAVNVGVVALGKLACKARLHEPHCGSFRNKEATGIPVGIVTCLIL